MLQQEGDVLHPFAESGHRQWYDIEAIVEVTAEIPGLHRRPELAGRGGDDPRQRTPKGRARIETLQETQEAALPQHLYQSVATITTVICWAWATIALLPVPS